MINNIIAFCAKNRFLVLLFVGVSLAWGAYSLKNIPLDAIPDLSDTQVIVLTEWSGRSPDLVEDQITYPIVSSMIAAPKVKVARGYSFLGLSFVYIIFEDGTDIYWARSRTLEYLSKIKGSLPDEVNPSLGPDATGVGWAFEYALVDETGQNDLSDLRSFQDWYLKYWLESVKGVAEVASIGGFVKQYQIDVDPNRLLAYNIPLKHVISQIQKSNNDVGGRVLEMAGTEYMIRGRGYIKSLEDVEKIAVGTDKNGTPILVKNIANVHFGPDMRRGAAELDGRGEVVGGIVIVRFGEDTLEVINRVKAKIEEIKPSLPSGTEIITTYDRSSLIERSVSTLKHKLLEEMAVVALIIIFFLWHFKSALIPIIALPGAVLLSFIPMFHMNLSSNIMSLGGIAIAIGAMVDASIIFVENAHKRLEEWKEKGEKESISEVLIHAAQEVGRPIFFSLLVIAVAFMPIFTLQAQEGRLFKPLAFTKNFSMFFAAILAITLVPALMQWFLKPTNPLKIKSKRLSKIVNFFWAGKIHSEEEHPVSRFLFKIYTPILHWVLSNAKKTIIIAAVIIMSIVPVYLQLGSEFMPPLNEGDILYMPTTLPGISIEESKQWLHTQDKLISQFGEVERVFGKTGRAKTATDPAPLSMVETTIKLKPPKEWPKVYHERWYSSWSPSWLKVFLRNHWPEYKQRTWEKLIADLDKELKLPATTNAWVMPIKTRIDMLTTGIRTPVGIKIFGADLEQIETIGKKLESIITNIDGTRSVYAERVTGGHFIDFNIKRDQIARYGLSVDDAQEIIETAIGGKNITTTIEGRERYPVNVRYARGLRDDIEKLKRVFVPVSGMKQIPIGELADIKIVSGPPVIKDENGMLTGWVYVDLNEGYDIGSYVKNTKQIVSKELEMPAGYYLSWSGQYEYMMRARERLLMVIPLTLFIILLLLYFNTRSWVKTGIVLLAVPFSLVGAFWLLFILGYNMSIAVWVGIIALAGVDAETGIVMLLYLDLAYERKKREGGIKSITAIKDSIMHGAVKRIRPKMMTVGTTFVGLLPIMWAATTESGADVMKRIAAPMVGGIFTSFAMELLVYPAIYLLWKQRSVK